MSLGINSILQQVSIITKKYNELAKITGENFNVFKILKVETKEVKLHSAFIAELLNPFGSHGQGNKFILEFINILGKKNEQKINFNIDGVKNVIVEKYLGEKTDNNGGRIDIILEDNQNNFIVIENKIYALDQENQLIRYNNAYKDSPIVYLTLYGNEPREYSIGVESEVKNKLICISFKEDILKWLITCKKYTTDYPLLRETITQYINTIKTLTNQTTNTYMSTEIVNQILKSGEIEAAFEIIKNTEELKEAIINELLMRLKIKKEGYVIDVITPNNKFLGRKDTAIKFMKKQLNQNVQLSFVDDFEKVQIGICKSNNEWIENKVAVFEEWRLNGWDEIHKEQLDNIIIEKVEKYFSEITF